MKFSAYAFCFFLRSAQRFFIASDSRFLPSGVSRPRRFLFLPAGAGFGPRLAPAAAEPSSAAIALPIRSASRLKSATILSISKVHSFDTTFVA
jgi:hypothetical protein